ncbi:MAG: hypothetical protein JHC33_05255 [Ignisphaera sp.]|nr:hypothetical protein [Ignisphaera sp.]
MPHAFLVRNGIDLGSLGKPIMFEYDTAGGAVTMFVYPKAWRVRVSEPDRSSKEVESDLVVSLTEKEVLISDALVAELCIVILNPRTGLWRFIDDDQSITRHSYRQQLWV